MFFILSLFNYDTSVEITEELHDAIANLPHSERSVVLLRLEEELSFKEIAQVVDAPLGTVLARMHRAKERMRLQLIKV